jgi:hypothetical protein
MGMLHFFEYRIFGKNRGRPGHEIILQNIGREPYGTLHYYDLDTNNVIFQ